MCGIVGATAERNVTPLLMEGIKRLEYRGYDSAGIALIDAKDHIESTRSVGKVAALADRLKKSPIVGTTGIVHTRWATHGEPVEHNAHPHTSNQRLSIVHNGIIENYVALRERLKKHGYTFQSETDSEVIAHLIDEKSQKTPDLITALREAVAELEGAYSIAFISTKDPHAVYGARSGSPLVVGFGLGENFIASDTLALVSVAQRFAYLEEGDLVRITRDTVEIFDRSGKPVERKIHESTGVADQSSKGNYRHYMLKEIDEQPQVAIDALDGRILHDELLVQAFGVEAPRLFPTIERVHIIACGTSYHAGLVARYWLESLVGMPCQVEVASENRYRDVVVEPNTLFVALSQSGETADTLAALRQAKSRGYAATLGICNVSGSSLVRESDLAFMIRAGREIGVAATKSFTAQLIALLLLTAAFAKYKPNRKKIEVEILTALAHLPTLLNDTLKLNPAIEKLSRRFADQHNVLFLGRGAEFPIALEGALKLKEISYIHAEAYPAGELKHGPLALVDKEMMVIVVAPNQPFAHKLQSNVQEVITRGGQLIVFTDETLEWPKDFPGTLIKLPKTPALLAPIVFNIPLQLLAYHAAVVKGTDVDQPRNLAKSVTVE